MTTPQVHLIMLGLGLLSYVLITGFRSSRTAKIREHRRRWWLGSIAAFLVALSPLISRIWRVPFNSIDLLTQALIFSGFSLMALGLIALLDTPYRAIRRFFRKRRKNLDYVLPLSSDGVPIAINADSRMGFGPTPGTVTDNLDPLQAILANGAIDKALASIDDEPAILATNNEPSIRTYDHEIDNIDLNASLETDIDLNFDFTNGSESKRANSDVSNHSNVDQMNNEKHDADRIASVMPMQGQSDGTQRLDKRLSSSSAANDKTSTRQNQNANSPSNSRNKTFYADTDEPLEDATLRIDELVDETLRLDELADDTLNLGELLPMGNVAVNDKLQADDEHRTIDNQPINGKLHTNHELQSDDALQAEVELQADYELFAEDQLMAEDASLAEDELNIASIPSEEDNFDLSESEHLYSKILSQKTEVELPDDKEIREAAQASAIDELDFDTALLLGKKSNASGTTISDRAKEEFEEAKVISAELVKDEADLEFGNNLTGAYAHPAGEYIPSPEEVLEQAEEQAHTTDHIAKQRQETDLTTEQPIELTQTAKQGADQLNATAIAAEKQAELEAEQTQVMEVAVEPEADQIHATATAAEKQAELEAEQAHAARSKTEEAAAQSTVDNNQPPPKQAELAARHAATKAAKPKTLTAALAAAKQTAQSVEAQVANLEASMTKLDKLRNASISSANNSVEQTNVLLSFEDEARVAAEAVITIQKTMLVRAKRQQDEVDVLLKQERDRMASLEKEVERSRKMARTAALLARKAAVAQQEIRSVAKREQTARLKSEESTRKAVNIARNAINALAEEERKRDLIQH